MHPDDGIDAWVSLAPALELSAAGIPSQPSRRTAL